MTRTNQDKGSSVQITAKSSLSNCSHAWYNTHNHKTRPERSYKKITTSHIETPWDNGIDKVKCKYFNFFDICRLRISRVMSSKAHYVWVVPSSWSTKSASIVMPTWHMLLHFFFVIRHASEKVILDITELKHVKQWKLHKTTGTVLLQADGALIVNHPKECSAGRTVAKTSTVLR